MKIRTYPLGNKYSCTHTLPISVAINYSSISLIMGFLFGRFCSFILFSNLSHHHHLPWLIEVEEGTFCYITNSDWANAGQLLRTSTTKWHDMLRTKPGLLFLDEKILLYIEEQWQRGRLWEINSSPLILNGIKSSWWVSLYQVRLMQSGRRQTLMCEGGLITETKTKVKQIPYNVEKCLFCFWGMTNLKEWHKH